jgi:hypothetical protein
MTENKQWNSALINATEYDTKKEELTIEFNNGQRYMYKNFSLDRYDSFCAAESQGKHFLTEIRKKYAGTEDVIKLTENEQSTRS